VTLVSAAAFFTAAFADATCAARDAVNSRCSACTRAAALAFVLAADEDDKDNGNDAGGGADT
jgi:hypothetical protein